MRPQTNAANPKQIKEAEKAQATFGEDLLWILSDRRGRRFYWNLMAFCGLFRTSFTGSSETFFNEGKRNVGLKLLSDLNLAAPEVYATMIKEEKAEE